MPKTANIKQTGSHMWNFCQKKTAIRQIIIIILIMISLHCNLISVFATSAIGGADFERATDAYMEKILSEYHVAGASVAAVKDGEILFSKGYGYADIENNIPVDGDTTAFQIASVTKLFTATAVMQMVEQGKLDLDSDINYYLRAFQIDNSFQTPVTLRHLLTHTSGLDDRTPLYVQSEGDILFDDIEPLEHTLIKHLPPVTREPGSYCQYSVMGMALAGYLVEEASGVPFDQYVSQNILEPLDMEYSSYGLTETILPYASMSYKYAKGEFIQGGYTLNSNHPSGAILASAGDMAKFMLAHLNGKGMILSPANLTAMHAHQFPPDERLTGYSLGFYETIRNGRRTIEHGGYLPRFSSKLTLLPEQNIGMFVALNTDSPESGKVCNEYVDLFYEHFIGNVSGSETAAPFDLDADAISGLYNLEGYGLKDPTKLKSQLITSRVECDDSGNLRYYGELELNFQYIGDGMFYSMENGNYCCFRQQGGEWVLNILGSDRTKVNTGERIQFLIFMASQPIFLGTLLLQIIFLLSKKQTTAGLVAAAVSLVDILYLAANVSMPILTLSGNTETLLKFIIPALPLIGWLYILAIVALAMFVLRAWRKRHHKIIERIVYSAFCSISFINLLFIVAMNGLDKAMMF